MRESRELFGVTGGTVGEGSHQVPSALTEGEPGSSGGAQRPPQTLGQIGDRAQSSMFTTETLQHCWPAKMNVPLGERHRNLSEIGAGSYFFPIFAQQGEEDIPLCSQYQQEGTSFLGCRDAHFSLENPST